MRVPVCALELVKLNSAHCCHKLDISMTACLLAHHVQYWHVGNADFQLGVEQVQSHARNEMHFLAQQLHFQVQQLHFDLMHSAEAAFAHCLHTYCLCLDDGRNLGLNLMRTHFQLQ